MPSAIRSNGLLDIPQRGHLSPALGAHPQAVQEVPVLHEFLVSLCRPCAAGAAPCYRQGGRLDLPRRALQQHSSAATRPLCPQDAFVLEDRCDARELFAPVPARTQQTMSNNLNDDTTIPFSSPALPAGFCFLTNCACPGFNRLVAGFGLFNDRRVGRARNND